MKRFSLDCWNPGGSGSIESASPPLRANTDPVHQLRLRARLQTGEHKHPAPTHRYPHRPTPTLARAGACLGAALSLLLVACGGNGGSDSSGTSASTASNTTATSSTGADSTTGAASTASDSTPITIGYSDWPGWTCWDIAEQQGFFKKHNVNVKLVWFPNYSDSLNALAAGQVDSNCQTWGDTMGPLAQGEDLKAVLVNDNSAGNDAIIAKPGINSVADLKGKKVATELGTVDHFLLLKALSENGMTDKDIQYVNIKVQDCPAAMIAGKVDAVAVWEPNKSKLLHDMSGSHDIYDSKRTPGLIPDLLVMQTKVVKARPQDVQHIVDAWYDMMAWWRAHPDDAVKIMAKRTDSPVSFYQGFIKGTRLFSAPEASAALQKSDRITSLYTSGGQIADFLMKVQQIPKVPDYAAAIDPTFVNAAVSEGLGKQAPYDYDTKLAQASPAPAL